MMNDNQNNLRKIKAEKDKIEDLKSSCVGFARDNKGRAVFAISGCPERTFKESEIIVNAIKDILGKDSIMATCSDSFTFLSENFFFDYSLTDFIYNKYLSGDRLLIPSFRFFRKSFLYFKPYLTDIGFNPRKFSCVERKIIGKTHFANCTLYVSMRPCYECLLATNDVCYMRNNKFYSLKRTYSNYYYDDFENKEI